jgi:hypothetical protein
MKVINLGDSSEDKIFALAYGPSGTGKTHFLGTLGELGSVLLIDIDQGYKTLKFAKDLKKFLPNITVCDFRSFKDLNNAAQLVDANDPTKWNAHFNKEVPVAQRKEWITKPFDWVTWDTWSEIQWFMLEELRSKDKDMKGDGLDFRKNIQIQHWGQMTDLNKLAIETLRECNVNQLFTMQEKADKDEVTGVRYGGPAIHGKMVNEMPTFFDTVIHTGTDLSGGFVATTKSKGLWPAKTRLGEGADFKNPTAKLVFGI